MCLEMVTLKKMIMVLCCIFLTGVVSCGYLPANKTALDAYKALDIPVPVKDDEWLQNDAGTGKPGDIKVYFADAKEKTLAVELRHVENVSIRTALDELIAGPVDLTHVKAVPSNMRCLGIAVKGDIAYINVDKALADAIVKGMYDEKLAVYALVNTVAHIPPVNKVQLLIDGKIVRSINDAVDISEPLAFNLAVVQMK